MPISEVNLRDVAKRAGVSAATVSRVFSGKAPVTEQTRAKVMDAAHELGYVVNALAKAMMGTAQRTLAFVAADLTDRATADIARGAEQVASRNGHGMLVSLTHGDPEAEFAIMASMCEQRVAGVVLVSTDAPGHADDERIAEYVHEMSCIHANLVLCGHPHIPTAPNVLTVNYDNLGGMRNIVKYLTGRGHTRIAFLGWTNTVAASQRFLGYSLGMKDAGLAIDSSFVVECANDIVEAHLATLLLLNQPSPPTAIVCLTDSVAMGVYRAARDLGIRIPGQLAVTGFDDYPCDADLTPPLTTIAAPFFDVGVRAGELALGLVESEQRVELPTELVVREST